MITLIHTFYTLNNKNDLFIKTLSNLKLIYEDDTTENLYKLLYKKNLQKKINRLFINGPKKIDFKNKYFELSKPTIIIGSHERYLTSTFESLIHEFNHAMSAIYKNNYFFDNKLISRVGISKLQITNQNLS